MQDLRGSFPGPGLRWADDRTAPGRRENLPISANNGHNANSDADLPPFLVFLVENPSARPPTVGGLSGLDRSNLTLQKAPSESSLSKRINSFRIDLGFSLTLKAP